MGQQGDAAEWWGTGDPIPVAAAARFRRERPLEVLAQLKSAVALPGLRIRISIDDVDQPYLNLERSLQVETRLDLTPGITTIRRTISLEQQSRGQLRIGVAVVDHAGVEISRREALLLIE